MTTERGEEKATSSPLSPVKAKYARKVLKKRNELLIEKKKRE